MNYKKIAALALALGCLAFPARAAEDIYVCYVEEGSRFIQDMTTAPISRLCAGVEDVTGAYLDKPRGYAFSIRLTGKWSDGTPVTAEAVMEAILETQPDWLELEYPLPEGEPIPLEEAGFASLEEAREAGFSRFYLNTRDFWGLEAGWLPIGSSQRLRDPAMGSGLLEYYVTPAYLYENYLASGRAYDRWQGEFLGVLEAGEPSYRILQTGEQQLVLFTKEPTAPSALLLKLSGIYPRDRENASCGPYRAEVQEDGTVLLIKNEYYAGPEAADCPEELLCRVP